MAEEPTTTVPEGQTPSATPDAAKNTETPPADVMIPKARFDEVNRRMRELETAQAKAAKEREEADQAKAVEEKRWQDLYESANKKAADLEAKLTGVEAERKQARIQSQVEKAAQAAGFADSADAVRFVEPDALQVDDDGNVANAAKVVAELAKNKPYLLAAAKPAPGVQPGPRPAGSAAVTDAEAARIAGTYGVRVDTVKQVMRQ